VYDDEYFEYLLGDSNHLGEEMFIMRKIGKLEVGSNTNQYAVEAYNTMHMGYKVRMEWKIGGLKRKWKRLMKIFDSIKPKYKHLFKVITIFTNFLCRH